MKVEVVLFGHYSHLLPPGSKGGRALVEVEEPATAADVLDRLGLPAEARTYVTIAGRRVAMETQVSAGDEIRVIVPLGGG